VVHQPPKRANKVKPWILILGIVAVIGLDLAFTSLINIENFHTVALDTIGINSTHVDPLPLIVDNSVESTLPDDKVSEAPPVVRRRINIKASNAADPRRNIVGPVSTSGTERLLPRVVAASQPRQQAPATPGTDRAISYPYMGSTYFVKVSRGLDTRTMSVTKDKKNSFASKALPVIKKPWQWMKALASKFR
jgi:hypothetical protein